MIEYVENEERQSLLASVCDIDNAFNKAISEKANDVEYFADAYLKILGAELDDETLKSLRAPALSSKRY
ncbi:portal protein [Streptococcus dysgalactiae subsp. equisimilis]|nr:portal protein [Streptococcus dysgalactiae subsp. equisimilis]